MSVPQFYLNNFRGRAVITTTNFSNDVAIKGDGTKTRFLSIANLSDRTSYLTNTASPAADVRSLNVRARSSSGSSPLDDAGTASKNYMISMFRPIRNIHADVLTSLPDNVTDLRLFKVWVSHGTTGIKLDNATVAAKMMSPEVTYTAAPATTFQVFPNPVGDQATVLIQSTESTTAYLKLFDSKGALVKEFEANVQIGSNRINIATAGLASGSYILQAIWSGQTMTKKLIKE